MVIYDYDKWDGMNENRVTPITLARFEELMRMYCHANTDLIMYKTIVEPSFKLGFFFKSKKKVDSYFQDMVKMKTSLTDASFPSRDESILCYNYLDEDEVGVAFVVIPFLNSMFAISSTSGAPDSLENCKKGYWKGEVKWFEKLQHRELWTDFPCLLIEKDIWDMMLENKKASE
jgi:hypothetical protein